MFRYCTLALLALLLAARPVCAAGDPAPAPSAPSTDVYFGTTVVDPYRNLENPNDSLATQWIAAEAARTRATLDALTIRPTVAAAVKAATPVPSMSDLTVVGGQVFYDERQPDGSTAIFERPRVGGPAHVVIASSSLGSSEEIGGFAVSPDGSLLALHASMSRMGTSAILIVRTMDGSLADASLQNSVLDAVGWLPDGRHIIYNGAGRGTTRDAAFLNARVYIHTLGEPQARDRAVFGAGTSNVEVAPSDFAFVDVPLGSAYAIAEVRDTANRGSRFYAVAVTALTAGRSIRWTPLGTANEVFTDYAVHGATIDLATAVGAPNFRVVRATLGRPFAPQTVLPGDAHAVVSGTLDGIPKAGIFALNAARDADYVQLLDGGAARIVRIAWAAPAKRQAVALPLRGTVLAVATDPRRDGALFDLSSWTDPGDIFAFAPAGNARPTEWRQTPIAPAATRVAMEVDATAADGTHVPVSIVRRADVPLDGSRPVLLQTIGAYGFSATPSYNAVPEAWLALGGIFVVAHVRGGGELGETWRSAGRGANKANTWNDLVAAAKLLVTKGYATPMRLGLYGPIASYLGGEAASIAVGRTIEERPDLFRAAVVDAPAFDLLRAETTFTGQESVDEFGSTSTRAGFEALYAMSPYAHVADHVAYPAVLVRSFSKIGVGDDWQAAKMVARLQASARNPSGALLDIAESRTTMRVDLYSFLLWQMAF